MSDAEAHKIILTIRQEIEDAVDVILTAAETALKELGAAREGNRLPGEILESRLSEILEACAFQDITGQRLSKLDAMVADAARSVPQDDPLLNGPALAGQGLDQSAADTLMRTFGS